MLSVEDYMELALEEAKKAFSIGEVPVGAVVVSPDGTVIGKGHNLKETSRDPTAHAEIVAIREAARRWGDWRLSGCSIFVTLEPCIMCCGAILHARISSLYYGARDEKFGAVESLIRALDIPGLNHRVVYAGGFLADRCSEIMREFFRGLRRVGREDSD